MLMPTTPYHLAPPPSVPFPGIITVEVDTRQGGYIHFSALKQSISCFVTPVWPRRTRNAAWPASCANRRTPAGSTRGGWFSPGLGTSSGRELADTAPPARRSPGSSVCTTTTYQMAEDAYNGILL